MMIGFRSVFFSIAITMLAVPVSAQQQDADDEPSDPDTGEATIEERTLGLLPNPLAKNGLKFSATYIGEGLGNPVGGFKQGGVYEGRLNVAIDVDSEKARLWEGGSFHVNAFEIHGRGLSRENVGNLITLSGVEALATTRLYELWYEQKWSDDRYSMRIGQLAADTEFLTSKYTDIFINSTFTWPAITNINLPAGGPSPPLAAVGVLGRAKLSEDVTVLGAVFDGNSAGPGFDDPQVRNRYGTNFRVNDPPFSIGEAQYSYKAPSARGSLPGQIKFGGWYHAGPFDDQRYGTDGRSLSDPQSSGRPSQHPGNWGLYGVVEQMLISNAADPSKGVAAFVRFSANPSQQNLIDQYADGGLSVSGFSQKRPNDKFGFGLAYARISDRARGLDTDYQASGAPRPIRNFEALAIASYLVDIRDGLQLLPSIQYVINPGGGLVNANDPTQARKVANAIVLGLRTVVKF